MFTEREQRCIELQNYVREQMIDSIIEDLHDIHAKYTTKHEVFMQEVADKDASAFIAGLIRLTNHLGEARFQKFCEYIHAYIYQDESEEAFLTVLEHKIDEGCYAEEDYELSSEKTIAFD